MSDVGLGEVLPVLEVLEPGLSKGLAGGEGLGKGLEESQRGRRTRREGELLTRRMPSGAMYRVRRERSMSFPSKTVVVLRIPEGGTRKVSFSRCLRSCDPKAHLG